MRKKAGTTLIEVTISLSLMAVIMLSLFSIIRLEIRSLESIVRSVTNQRNAVKVVDYLAPIIKSKTEFINEDFVNKFNSGDDAELGCDNLYFRGRTLEYSGRIFSSNVERIEIKIEDDAISKYKMATIVVYYIGIGDTKESMSQIKTGVLLN